LTSVVTSADGTTIKGTLSGPHRKAFVIQFFANPAGDNGEGHDFLGEQRVRTNSKGKATFAFTLPAAQAVAAGQFVTATATRETTGDTSEFSEPREATVPAGGRRR
jgi:hypothetical protein